MQKITPTRAMSMNLTREVAAKVLATVDAGLVHGVGVPEPGKMCVEAAVCYALGLPHGDNPTCVGDTVRWYKIHLNDAKWSSNAARAKGLRRVAIAQLGSDTLDQCEIADRLVISTVREVLPPLLRKHGRETEAVACEGVTTREGARVATRDVKRVLYAASDASDASDADDADDASDDAAFYAASDAAFYASDASTRDEILTQAANRLERILVDMRSPGAAWLDLTEAT